MSLHFNKQESTSSNDNLWKVWLKLAHWFWIWIQTCERFTERQTDTRQKVHEQKSSLISFQLRWAYNVDNILNCAPAVIPSINYLSQSFNKLALGYFGKRDNSILLDYFFLECIRQLKYQLHLQLVWWSEWFEYWHQIAQLVEHLTRDSGGPGLNSCLVSNYFSHPVTLAYIFPDNYFKSSYLSKLNEPYNFSWLVWKIQLNRICLKIMFNTFQVIENE